MRLLSNWREILQRAWSVRLMIIAGGLSALEVVLPIVREIVLVPPGWFAVASLAVTFGAVIARISAQNNLTGGNDGQPNC